MMKRVLKKIGVYVLLVALVIAMTPGITLMGYADKPEGSPGGDDGWSKSSLEFKGGSGDCQLISAEVTNGGSGNMSGTVVWELYWIASGNPKDGVVIGSGTIGPLESGSSATLSYNPADNPNGANGNYMFKAYQEDGHPGIGVLWSDQISLDSCVVPDSKGMLTVTKTFSDQNSAEVTVLLMDGETQVDSKVTVNHVATFSDLDLSKSYSIVESPVPEGYSASYPDGQAVVFNDDHGASLGILNTLIPTDPDKGKLTVTKTFSDQNAAEVTVGLYEVTGEGDVLLDSKLTSGHVAMFNNLDLEKSYKIAEIPVPDGYVVSYPSGQAVVFNEDNMAALGITNTLIPKGTLTVTKTFSDQNAAEVTVVLYEMIENSPSMVDSKVTENHVAVFNNLDLEKSYVIGEVPVPQGYAVSYPDGSNVVFNDDHMASLGILNTLIPPEKGALRVVKSYNDSNAGEVTVELFKVVEGVDVLVTSQVTSGLSTTFENLDMNGVYKIVENPVVNGYTVSYPDGQSVTIDSTEAAALRILNTAIVIPPGGGGGGGGTVGGGGGSGGGGGDANQPSAVIATEPTPLAAPEPVVQPVPAAPEAVTLPEEQPPKGALPKTGELPSNIFYGLGGMLMAIGTLIRRR